MCLLVKCCPPQIACIRVYLFGVPNLGFVTVPYGIRYFLQGICEIFKHTVIHGVYVVEEFGRYQLNAELYRHLLWRFLGGILWWQSTFDNALFQYRCSVNTSFSAQHMYGSGQPYTYTIRVYRCVNTIVLSLNKGFTLALVHCAKWQCNMWTKPMLAL